MPKQLLNNSKPTFKKYKKRLFWPPKWSKWPSQRAKIWPKILILEVIYRPFDLKIHLKVSFFRPKTMPKQLLNNSKPTFKKSKKRLFWPPKWSKCPSQRAKIWRKKIIFYISTFQAKNTTESLPLRAENNAETTSEQLQTNFRKSKIRLFWSQKWSNHGYQFCKKDRF